MAASSALAPSSVAPRPRLGIDIGGTFTDVVLDMGTANRRTSVKVLTTPRAPEDAIIDGLLKVCALATIAPTTLGQIVHGTTLATNALIERKGAKTVLVTTKGFRDVIEMRTESRFEQYDLDIVLPTPLLERQHRLVVDERLAASGEVLRPLDATEADRIAATIAERGYESVAIGLIHAYANGQHEDMLRRAILARVPGIMVTISSEVSPQMREYERFNTTIANAYVKPMMQRYLARLKGRLAEVGVACPVFLMHSGGGIISLESAAEFPVRLVESGPAGGAIFAARIAERHGLPKALSFDMGGTTAKICLVRNARPKTSRVFEVARQTRFKKGSGMPISIPVIDMVEIGAGGGSLARVDALGRITVGPESAGSEPGPACYGRGGTRPAVTDSDLVLGRLDPVAFAGGTIPLSAEHAAAALGQHIGQPLAMDAAAAAFGVSEVVDENMANAARVHAVENGEDPADYTMIAFGGAAPLHAGRLAAKLGIARVLVPPGAGVGSAIGFLEAPFSFEATRSVYMRLADFDGGRAREVLDALGQEAVAFVRTCDADAPITREFKVFMRYVGQGWEIPVPLTDALLAAPDRAAWLAAFEAEYRMLFGRTVAGLDTEITVWACNAATSVSPPARVALAGRTRSVSGSSTRQLFDPTSGRMVEAAVIERAALAVGTAIAGPALITEAETTIVVPTEFTATCRADGCIELVRTISKQPV